MLKASELKTGSVIEINGVAHVVKQIDVKNPSELIKVNTETGKFMSRA